MASEQSVDVIVSMIIQNLRFSKHTKIIELIKKSEYVMKWRDHDNWIGVAPFTGAWIEINMIQNVKQRFKVAPFTGAWIEIGKSFGVR